MRSRPALALAPPAPPGAAPPPAHASGNFGANRPLISRRRRILGLAAGGAVLSALGGAVTAGASAAPTGWFDGCGDYNHEAAGVIADPGHDRVYVTCDTVGQVHAFDVSVSPPRALATLPAGSQPWFGAVNPSTGKVYVANADNGGYGGLTVIDGNTLTARTIQVQAGPMTVAVNSARNQVYVTNNTSGTLSVIDGSTDTVTQNLPIGYGPWGVAYDAGSDRIIVANCGDSQLKILDAGTLSVVQTVNLPMYPRMVTVNPATNRVYVTSSLSGGDQRQVTILDGFTFKVLATLETTTGVRDYNGKWVQETIDVKVDSTRNLVYVTDASMNTAYGGSLTIIDGSTNRITHNLSSGFVDTSGIPNPLFGMDLIPQLNEQFVASWYSDQVYILTDDSTPPRSVITTPEGEVFTPSLPIWNGGLAGYSTDDESGISGVRVIYTNEVTGSRTVSGAYLAQSCQFSTRGGTPCSWSSPLPSLDGEYLAQAFATDWAGNPETPGPGTDVWVV
ncbi:MAG: YncE family protein [Candidatus Dormibacteria bacterium]